MNYSKVTDDVHYLSAIEESKFMIAQANATLDSRGHLIDELVSCRIKNEFMLSTPDKVDYIDVARSWVRTCSARRFPA